VAFKDLKTPRHSVSPSVLHLCRQLHRESVHFARGGHRVSALLGAKQLKQLGASNATFAIGSAASGAKVSANVSQTAVSFGNSII
jgi:acyl CoA:acetate/3-ketoacid CoA transferase beta subunit